ncbi:ParB/RepB/Spo0J family partition protein [Blautia sp.]|uniref:ParB/RepB/Spo0J family partition protein n=1 Tax=Blautia sp. TaxID=1955243 RepID=UPI003A924555
MAGKKSGLGRGLDALFPEKTVQSKPKTTAKTVKQTKTATAETKKSSQQENSNGARMMKLSMIEPNREQPRKKFDEDALQELADSIKQYGVLQPLLVSDKKDYYEIVAGERRWRAAKLAGLKEVPVVVRELSTQEIVEISLIENIQREDLNPVEEAMAYKRLIDEFHMKQDEIAERVSKSRTAVTNSMRLLKLDARVQQMMVDEMISAGHARAILAIDDSEKQYTTAMKVFDEKLSVRETEKLVKTVLAPSKKKDKVTNPAEDAIYESLEERMKGITGTRVFIHRKKNNKVKIEIEYYSRDDLDRIIDLFESIG